MKKSRFTAEQIVSILNEATKRETKLAEICRKHGITEQTYYRWRRAVIYRLLYELRFSDAYPRYGIESPVALVRFIELHT